MNPKHLTINFKQTLLSQLKEKYEKKYYKERGENEGYYIIEIKEIVSFTNSITNANSMLYITANCKTMILSIGINKTVSGVCKIAGNVGIFVVAGDGIAQVFISKSKIERDGIVYDESKCEYVKKGETIYKNGTIAKIKVLNMSYTNNVYKYIGDYLEKGE